MWRDVSMNMHKMRFILSRNNHKITHLKSNSKLGSWSESLLVFHRALRNQLTVTNEVRLMAKMREGGFNWFPPSNNNLWFCPQDGLSAAVKGNMWCDLHLWSLHHSPAWDNAGACAPRWNIKYRYILKGLKWGLCLNMKSRLWFEDMKRKPVFTQDPTATWKYIYYNEDALKRVGNVVFHDFN